MLASPAAAEPITPQQAATALSNAVIATNAANNYRFNDAQMPWSAAFNRAAGQYEQDGISRAKVFTTGTYAAIQWPSPRVRTKVRGPQYLNTPRLEWAFLAAPIDGLELPMWEGIADDRSGERRGMIAFPPREIDIAYADRTVSPATTRYTIGNEYYESVYTVDAAGRITRIDNLREAGESVSGHVRTWEYDIPVEVTTPAADSHLPYPTVERAIEAASLNSTLKGLAQEVARQNRGRSLRQMRVDAQETIGFHNGGGEGDQAPVYVKLKVRNIAGGVRMFRKNPFTGTFHEWQIRARGENWRATKTAP